MHFACLLSHYCGWSFFKSAVLAVTRLHCKCVLNYRRCSSLHQTYELVQETFQVKLLHEVTSSVILHHGVK
eukprot:2259294-Amphidinium_carterae.1